MKEVLHTVVEIGLEKPVKVLQITDVHITEAKDTESEKTRRFTQHRDEVFLSLGRTPESKPQETLVSAFEFAKAEGAFPILTGDIIDFDTVANREVAVECLKGRDFLYTAGSHEFQTTNWLEPLDEEGDYYPTVRKELMSLFGSLDFDHRIINGVNLITMDNSMDFFSEDSYVKLQGEISRGLPMVLFMHVPLVCGSLKRPPEECNNRFTQEQYEINLKTIELIESCPLIKATFAGHWHGNYEYPDHQPPTYVAPGTFTGVVRMIEIR